MKVGVVGAGVFAGYHAGKVRAHEHTSLSGIFDIHPDRTQLLADRYETVAQPSLAALVRASDALIVASPSNQHTDAAIMALTAGLHVLVEKPLTDSVRDAEVIVAAQGNSILQVGHQERLVAQAVGLNRIPERPEHIDIVRQSPRSTRNLDTGVVMDLMIHDLDLLGWLYGAPEKIARVEARSIYSDHLDEATVELDYGTMRTRVTSSRDADLERYWKLHFKSGIVTVDFGQKTLSHNTDFDLDEAFGDKPDVKDSLAGAFDRFVSACLDGKPPLATGADGLQAVKLAEAIRESA